MPRIPRLFPLLLACLAPLPAANIPRPAMELKFKLPSGQEVALSSYKGKVVVLEIFITTCPHCQKSTSALQKLSKEYAGQPVEMLAVAVNDNDDKILPDYIKKFGITYPMGYNMNRMAVVDFLQHPIMTRMLMPQLVFIDRDGVIQEQHGGDDQAYFGPDDDKTGFQEKSLHASLERLLNPAAAKKAPARKKTN